MLLAAVSVSALSDSSLKSWPNSCQDRRSRRFSIRSFGFLAEIAEGIHEAIGAYEVSVSALSDSSLKSCPFPWPWPTTAVSVSALSDSSLKCLACMARMASRGVSVSALSDSSLKSWCEEWGTGGLKHVSVSALSDSSLKSFADPHRPHLPYPCFSIRSFGFLAEMQIPEFIPELRIEEFQYPLFRIPR